MLKTKQTYNGLLTFRTTSLFIGEILDLYEEYSPNEVDLLKVMAKDRNVILAGANIGAIAVPVGAVAKYLWAFEPNPLESTLLGINILQAGHIRTSWLFQAVGERLGKMYCPVLDTEKPGNIGGASLLGWTSQDHTFEVDVETIDHFLTIRPNWEPGDQIGLIIADTEGMEIHVVKGALETIKRDQPYLYLENSFDNIPADENNPYGRQNHAIELIQLVESLGYEIYYHFPKLTEKAQEGQPGYGVVSYNMLCIPKFHGYEFSKLEQASWKLSPIQKLENGRYLVKQKE